MSTPTVPRIRALVAPSTGAPLGPFDAGWRAAEEVEVPLEPTPLGAQPSAYVQAAWADRSHGATPSARVAAAVSDGVLHVRVRWAAPDPRPAITDNNVFADACALLFSLDGRDAELSTMGSPDRPVQAWHWRAGTAVPFVLEATGLGTSTRLASHNVTAAAEWTAGEWSVVFARPLNGGGVPLAAGAGVPLGLAVWQGANEERAGLAAHTPEWLRLELPGGTTPDRR